LISPLWASSPHKSILLLTVTSFDSELNCFTITVISISRPKCKIQIIADPKLVRHLKCSRILNLNESEIGKNFSIFTIRRYFINLVEPRQIRYPETFQLEEISYLQKLRPTDITTYRDQDLTEIKTHRDLDLQGLRPTDITT